MRSIAESTNRITASSFSRKYISLGRIISQWEDVIGAEFSGIAHPVKLNYRKSKKNEKALATLDIATTAAHTITLHYQKDLILERINRIFGNDWISDIRFVTIAPENDKKFTKKVNFPLTQDEKNYLSDVLGTVTDPEIREKLEKLGQALITDQKK